MKTITYKVVFETSNLGSISSMTLQVKDNWIISMKHRNSHDYIYKCPHKTFPFIPSDYLLIVEINENNQNLYASASNLEKLYKDTRVERIERWLALQNASNREIEEMAEINLIEIENKEERYQRYDSDEYRHVNQADQALMKFGIPDPRLLG
jgi:hypothetical protein